MLDIMYKYFTEILPNQTVSVGPLAAAEAAEQQQSCHTEPHRYRIILATDIHIWIICTKC